MNPDPAPLSGRFSLKGSRALRWSLGVGLAVMVGIGLVLVPLAGVIGAVITRILTKG